MSDEPEIAPDAAPQHPLTGAVDAARLAYLRALNQALAAGLTEQEANDLHHRTYVAGTDAIWNLFRHQHHTLP